MNENYKFIRKYNMKPISAYTDFQTERLERFAWLPKKTSSGEYVWLVKYIILRKQAKVTPTNIYQYENIYTLDEYVDMKLRGIVE